MLRRRTLDVVRQDKSKTDLDPRTLRHVLHAHGLLSRNKTGSAGYVFDAKAGREVASTVLRSVPANALPEALNCTRPQAEQLLAERVLVPILDGARPAPGRTQKAIDGAVVAAFNESFTTVSRIADQPPRSGSDPVASRERGKSNNAIAPRSEPRFRFQVAYLDGATGLRTRLSGGSTSRSDAGMMATGRLKIIILTCPQRHRSREIDDLSSLTGQVSTGFPVRTHSR